MVGHNEQESINPKKKKQHTSFQKTCRKALEHAVETVTDSLFWQESDKVQRGRLLRWVHETAGLTYGFMILLLHTLFPSWILLKCILFLTLFVSFTHALTGVCVITTTEIKYTKEDITIADPVLSLFGLPRTTELRTFVTIYTFLALCGVFLYEAGARGIPTLRGWVKV
jgi:hypothetical protein